jgi:hypothetical protein
MASVTKWHYWVEEAPDLERLNQLGDDGWELVGLEGSSFYFKRPASDFREQVTLDQKRRYYATWAIEGVE